MLKFNTHVSSFSKKFYGFGDCSDFCRLVAIEIYMCCGTPKSAVPVNAVLFQKSGMAATRRIKKELLEIQELGLRNFKNLQVDEENVLAWQGLIVPDDPPYNKGAFKIEINFPVDYPFRPPKLFFHTKIYHPNIDEQGYVCLPIIMTDYWRPATRMTQVISAVIALISNPDPHYALRSDAAEELMQDRRKFMITAEQFTIQNALPRPKEK